MKSVLFTLILIATIQSPAHEGHTMKQPMNGRTGLHGMVLYGAEGQYFIDHIPMEHPPHDFQIVAEISIKDNKGVPVKLDLSNDTFTLKPSASFSLNNYINGHLTQFVGDIYEGGFEQNGKVLSGYENVTVTVKNISFARPIPNASTETSVQFAAGKTIFEVNVITPARNFQAIKNKSTGEYIWCVKGPDFFEPCP